ncbi:MAG: Gfo/Idh/MocA family oxidoreductase [Candidatus Zipacnadales bacterium]
MSKQSNVSRRSFVKASAAGAVATSLGWWSGATGQVSGANNRINMAVIGTGGMGTGHVHELTRLGNEEPHNCKLIAVCDVYDNRANYAASVCGGEAYRNYRKLLERKDIDAVVVATPDHWHKTITIEAMEAGKDVYCQKPMTLYWEEAKEVVAAVKRTGRIVQVGAQGCSDDVWWKAQEQIKAGKLGKLIWSQSGAYRNVRGGDWNYAIDPNAKPGENLDWEMWLGPAPKVPWDPERYFRFRKFWDYSGGLATDLLYHSLSHMLIAVGPEFPKRVVASGGIYAHHDREVPDTFHVLIDYPSDHTIALHATQANEQGLPEIIRGEGATMYFEGPGLVIRPEAPFAEGRETIEIAREPRPDHMHNFLDCVRSRKKPHLDEMTGYKTQVAISLSVAAYREGKVKLFDPEKEEVIQ